MKNKKNKGKKSNFVDKPNKDFDIYRKGSLIGGLIGGITGLVIGKKIILSIVIGALAGGYIAYQVNSNDEVTNIEKFKNKK